MDYMKMGIRVLGVGFLVAGGIVLLLLAVRMGSVYGWHHTLQNWLASDVGLRPTLALLGALLGDAILLVTFWSLARLVVFGSFSPATLGVAAALFAVFAALTMFGEHNVPQPIAADRPLFHRDGKPNAWCSSDQDRQECFDLPGHHPRTGIRLEPVNPASARRLEAQHAALRADVASRLAAALVPVTMSSDGAVGNSGPSSGTESLAAAPSAKSEPSKDAARASTSTPNFPSSSYPRVQFDVVGVEARAETVHIQIRYQNRTSATLYLSHPGVSECGDGARLSDDAANEYSCREGLGQIANGRGLELGGGGSATHVFTFAAIGRLDRPARRFTLRLPHVVSEMTNPQGFQGSFGHQIQTLPLPVANYPLVIANISP